jgi:hypothetical protein
MLGYTVVSFLPFCFEWLSFPRSFYQPRYVFLLIVSGSIGVVIGLVYPSMLSAILLYDAGGSVKIIATIAGVLVGAVNWMQDIYEAVGL